MSDFNPAQTGYTRVFIIDGRARPDHVPAFQSCMRAQSLSKPFGDVTDIECPSPTEPGKFNKVGQIQSGDDRATLTLEGRHALDLRSILLNIAQRRCPVDVQIHYSDCEDLSQFNLFKKVMFLEDALMTEYGTEDIGALEDDQQSAINETAPVSASKLYDFVPLSFSEEGEDVISSTLLDVVICDDVSCGFCKEGRGYDESDGCQKVYSISTAAAGSPVGIPDVIFSLDGGLTWYAHDIDTLLTGEDPNALACVSGWLVIVSNATNSLHYTPLIDITGLMPYDPVFVQNGVGFVAGGEPNDIWSVGNKAWIVGDGGYIYVLTDPAIGVTVQDAGEATPSILHAVHALNENFAVAVGNDGIVLVAEDGTNWSQSPNLVVGIGTNLTSVWVKSKTEWWVTANNGNLYYTLDGGEVWTQKAFYGDEAGIANAIVFATDSIAYLAHTTADDVGRLLTSFDGGYSWIVLPQMPGEMPLAHDITAIAACQADPKLLVAVGQQDAAQGDGLVIVGRN